MKASQLRDLSRKYASGKMSRENYLAERRRLIEAITRGEMELTYRELDPLSGGNHSSRGSRPSRTMIAAAGLLLVLLVAFTTHFLSGNGNKVENDTSSPTTRTQEDNFTQAAVDALENFAATDDWSDTALAQLESRWKGFTDAERSAARDTVVFRRLSREVQARIREHEALVAAGGNPDALMRAARLRMFAEKLGLST